MSVIYSYPTVSSLAQDDRLLLSKAGNNSTAQVTIDVLKDGLGVIDTITASSPIIATAGNHSVALSLTTVPVSLGGTGLTSIGSAGESLVVNPGGTALTYESRIAGSGTSLTIPSFNGTSSLTDSPIKVNANNVDISIPQYIYHEGDNSRFGFNDNDKFLIYLGDNNEERITLSDNSFAVRTDSGNKITAGADNVVLFVDDGLGGASTAALGTQVTGIYVKGNSTNKGAVRYYAGDDASYVGIEAAATGSTYTLTLPSSAPGGSGKILATSTTGNELEWIDGSSAVGVTQITAGNNVTISPVSGVGNVTINSSGTIGGTVSANDIPVGTAANTLGDSIMSQHVATSSPTHHRIRIESPVVNPNLGQFPSLQLYNGSNGSWSTGAILSEIQTYSADASTPSNPHVCSFINTVRGETLSGAAVDGELVFGTAPYNEPVGAQESMRIDRDGSILVKQVGISTDDNYRTGNVSVQNTGEFRLYGSSPFTGSNYHSIKNNNGALEIGDQAGFSGTINFFVDQASALEINDSAESTFKQSVTVSAGDLTVSSGDIIAGSNGDFKTSGNGHFFSGDGTQIRPAFTFDSDNDTGLYLASAGLMRFSSSGINVASIDGTGVEVFNNLKIKGNRNNSSNVQTTNGIIELSNNSTSAFGFQSNIDSNSQTTGANRHIIFRYNGTEVGYIRNATSNSVVFATNASDERKKKNIVNWDEKVLEDFSSIEPKKFNYLNEEDSDGLTKGFIAQQMVDKFPEAYPKDADTENETGYYSFNPSGMTVYLMKAVKELKEEIDALNNRIKVLES